MEDKKIETKKVSINSPDYPEKIRDFADGYKTIYARGNFSLVNTKSIAVVGSRKCTPYGRVVAKEIGRKCAEYGVTLVSGLAKGIDGAGMSGAIEAGGNVIAVLGQGTDIVYPKTNLALHKKIEKNGLIISEYPDGTMPKRFTFVQRNRIISALSDAVIVVEAGVRSGSLITAEYAADQGKNVFAVPGNITSSMSLGTNKLISEGAMPVTIIDDIFRIMGIKIGEHNQSYNNLGKDEIEILNMVKNHGEISIDELSSLTKKRVDIINGIITVLEIKGFVFCEMGKVGLAKLQ